MCEVRVVLVREVKPEAVGWEKAGVGEGAGMKVFVVKIIDQNGKYAIYSDNECISF